jgi:AAA+ superfamily predicted ATPase
VEGNDCDFELEAYVRAGHCSIVEESSIHSQTTRWQRPGKKLWREFENAWFNVFWRGHLLDVLLITWTDDGCKTRHYWVAAETEQIAEDFFRAVCEWYTEVRGEILVFDGGCWQKNKELLQAIKGATFENLILPDALKQEIERDLAKFFASREVYEKYRIPWKRGILLIGPPGTGKTHTIKALINSMGQACLYVKSFKSRCATDQDNMREVFSRARRNAPCILVLEDLDSLLDAKNRSFFLNELDGFATNTGVLVLATTNHPEKLDPAILDRPSRFDRKYYFELPSPAERLRYISAWNDALQAEMRLSATAIIETVERTDGFSFAYMKELFLSSMMQWMAEPASGRMDAVMHERSLVLREQMSSMVEETNGDAEDDQDDED